MLMFSVFQEQFPRSSGDTQMRFGGHFLLNFSLKTTFPEVLSARFSGLLQFLFFSRSEPCCNASSARFSAS
jgi:hypothetical protein